MSTLSSSPRTPILLVLSRDKSGSSHLRLVPIRKCTNQSKSLRYAEKAVTLLPWPCVHQQVCVSVHIWALTRQVGLFSPCLCPSRSVHFNPRISRDISSRRVHISEVCIFVRTSTSVVLSPASRRRCACGFLHCHSRTGRDRCKSIEALH